MLSSVSDKPAVIEMNHRGLRGVVRRQTANGRGQTYGALSLEIRDDNGVVLASTFGPVPLSPREPIVLSSADGSARLSILCGIASAAGE